MRDVAARAGVSRSLVSTVFRDVPGASPATRERVLAAAAELGYRPDERARKLRSHDSRLIGVTLTAVNPFHAAVTEDLNTESLLRGYELFMSLTAEGRTLASAFDALLAQRCGALILIGPTAPDDVIAELVDQAGEVPVVIVDRFLDLPEADVIRVDDTAGMRMAIAHLMALGHREIWYLDGGTFVSADPRRDGFIRAAREAGITDGVRIVPAGGTRADGAAAAVGLLAGDRLPTAIVAYNDLCAFGVLDVFARHGVDVPGDVSIVGFDNVPEASMDHLSLTTVEQCSSALALAVSEVVVARLSGAPPQGLRLMPPSGFLVRSSTGAPRPAPLQTR